jgi:uncharacterized membrane protein
VADTESSTGLATHIAAPLAYAGWWATGLLFWLIERRDPIVRFHAAQSLAAFGAIALALLLLAILALLSLTFLPQAFDAIVIAAEMLIVLGLVLWGISMWRAASGRPWRIPLAAGWADRIRL